MLVDLVHFYANLANVRATTSALAQKHGAALRVHYRALQW